MQARRQETSRSKALLFVRHGESVANAGGVTMAHADIPLSARGRAQALALAGRLEVEPAEILVSSYLRAQETARPFCDRHGLEGRTHALVHEFSSLDPALLEGMTGEQRRPLADAYWRAAQPGARHGPAAETFEEFDARVAAFIAQMPALGDRTVVFGHGIWIGLLCWKLSGFGARTSAEMRAFRRFQTGLPMPNGAVYVVEDAGDGAWRWRPHESLVQAVAQQGDPSLPQPFAP